MFDVRVTLPDHGTVEVRAAALKGSADAARLARFDFKGQTYFIAPENVYATRAERVAPDGPWYIVDARPSRRATTRRAPLTNDEKAVLDEAVFDALRRRGGNATATQVWRQLDNAGWFFDDAADEPSEATHAFFSRASGVRLVDAALKRLERAGRLTTIYDRGLTGRETLTYEVAR